MHFIVSSSLLLKNLQLVSGIISPSVVLPILENFLFDISGNRLTITGADMETMIKASMDIQAGDQNEGSGKKLICIPSKILIEYLKNLPEQPLHITLHDEDNSVELSSNTGKYKIGGENGQEYPKEPQEEGTTNFQMSAEQLTDAINKTIFATSVDNLRPAMTGVFFEFEEGEVNFVATDAHRLVKLTRTDISVPEAGSIIVPKKPLQQLKNILASESGNLEISYNQSHLFIRSERVFLNCRLIEGKFPPYRAVIPTENPYSLTINRVELLSALRRVNVFSNKSTSQVVFDIEGNTLNISAQDIDFSYEGNEKMACQYDGEDMKIAFNSRLLIEMMNNLNSEEVKLELSMPSKAGIFKPVDTIENEDLLMLLMPLMVGI